jgi:hypothetical protein
MILVLLMAAFGLFTFFSPGGPPAVIHYYSLIVNGIGGLIALVGLWLMKRWGLWLTIIISAASILTAVTGLLQPVLIGKAISAGIFVVNAVVLVLLVLPATRAAFAGERARAAA